MFRNYNGISKKLLTEQKCLYLKADMDSFVFSNASPIEQALVRNINEVSPKVVILDIATVTTMDSTGVGVLISVTAECKKNGCSVYLCNVDEHVLHVFDILQIGAFIPVVKLEDFLGMNITK